jgi:hypothetical protein
MEGVHVKEAMRSAPSDFIVANNDLLSSIAAKRLVATFATTAEKHTCSHGWVAVLSLSSDFLCLLRHSGDQLESR